MYTNLLKFFLPAVSGILFLTSCKKDVDVVASTGPAAVSTTDKLKDSTLIYSQDLYLWYKQIPGTFNPRTFSGPESIMTALRQFSVEPGFSQPVDRWSFAMKQTDWNRISSGVSGDFGLQVFFHSEGDLRVKAVESASPAGKAGVRRGWRVTAINGNANLTTSNSDFISGNVYKNSSTKFTFLKPDGNTVNISLNTATYQEHPVYLDTIYQAGGKKIGYFVFNSFLGDTTEIYQRFQQMFQRFSSNGINDLIVDLRYNGGGYVTVQKKLANYLVPSSANGSLMMKQEFNNKYTNFNTVDNFKKLGSLNLPRIFFIVSSSTASASELLINNLKPYMEVKLIGPKDTYGKPVGFFPVDVEDWYIFPVSFKSTNKNGEGSYYNGIPVHSQVQDGLDKDWGDQDEACLARAMKFITTGTFQSRIAGKEDERYVEQPNITAVNQALDEPSFKGMIDTRGQ